MDRVIEGRRSKAVCEPDGGFGKGRDGVHDQHFIDEDRDEGCSMKGKEKWGSGGDDDSQV